MSGYERTEDYGYSEYDQVDRSQTTVGNYTGLSQPNTSNYSTPSTFLSSSQAPEIIHTLSLASGNEVPTYQPRDAPLNTGSTYTGTRVPTSTPPIYEGDAGHPLQMNVEFSQAVDPEKCTFTYRFANYTTCKGEIQPQYYPGSRNRVITVQIPDLGPNPLTMALVLDIVDENHRLIKSDILGNFRYTASNYQPYVTGGKRKLSDFSEGAASLSSGGSLPSKRLASQPLRSKDLPSSSVTGMYEPLSNLRPMYASGEQDYNNPAQPQPQPPPPPPPRYYENTVQGRDTYTYSPHPSPVPLSIKARSPQIGSANSLRRIKSPRTSSKSMSRSISMNSTPTLIRTSMASRSNIRQPTSHIDTPSFNPYEIYPGTKAKLKLEGDLNSMTSNWTDEEVMAQRRIVEFERVQQGSTIEATFKAVSPTERSASNPCISCIWWERKQEYYCTSVDTIMLLEQLVSVVFTVEEKNRIRRNLEGFKPFTVSKTDPDSEDVFKLIMGFPTPKPRNIEKDIKIFYWRSLEKALKKIIGKYSASYASTSSVMTPSTTTYAATDSSSQLSTVPTAPASLSSIIAPYPDMTNPQIVSPRSHAQPSQPIHSLNSLPLQDYYSTGGPMHQSYVTRPISHNHQQATWSTDNANPYMTMQAAANAQHHGSTENQQAQVSTGMIGDVQHGVQPVHHTQTHPHQQHHHHHHHHHHNQMGDTRWTQRQLSLNPPPSPP